jgi:ribosomal protein L27
MAGGKARPKKDLMLKVSGGQMVKTGQILSRGMSAYKAGGNVKGLGTLYALCEGKVYFSKKKTSRGRLRTFINVLPVEKKGEPKE